MEIDHIKGSRFKKETVDFILEHYMNMSSKEISKVVNIPPQKINQILRQHGIKPLDGHCILHLEDFEKFKKMYPVCTMEELCIAFPYINKKSFHSIACKIGVKKINAPSNNRYTEEELLGAYKQAYDSIGRIPTDREHNILGLASADAYRHRFGSKENICKLCGIPFIRNSTNIFGHHIGQENNDSNAEMLVENAIKGLNIPYISHISYSKYFDIEEFGNRKVDFILTDSNIVVEYFGLIGNKEYEEKMETKIDLCNKYNIKLVALYPKDVNYRTIEYMQQIIINKINQVS